MEVPILYYNYRCHIRHYDDPNLRKIIQLHIQVCEEIGNRECLPVEGDLITLAFECKGEEQFFYDWLNEGAMHNGEIHFIYNEVEIADNSPMMMVLYLSPGIIKRNNLEVREKVWKVSDISQQPIVSIASESKEEKQPEIVEVYWKDAGGTNIIEELPKDGIVTLYAKTINTQPGDKLSFTIILEDGKTLIKVDDCIVDAQGVAKMIHFDLKKYKQNNTML